MLVIDKTEWNLVQGSSSIISRDKTFPVSSSRCRVDRRVISRYTTYLSHVQVSSHRESCHQFAVTNGNGGVPLASAYCRTVRVFAGCQGRVSFSREFARDAIKKTPSSQFFYRLCLNYVPSVSLILGRRMLEDSLVYRRCV